MKSQNIPAVKNNFVTIKFMTFSKNNNLISINASGKDYSKIY
jgi:hypothetical protein